MNYKEKVAKLDNDLQLAEQYKDTEIIDTSALNAELEHAEQMKTLLSEYNSMQEMEKDCKRYKAESKELTEKIELARKLPGKILENCKLPIENLSVENGMPLINGLPISNLSNGQKIDLCVDIAISKPNNFEILLLDGTEQLDEESRNQLYKRCKEKGVNIIATRTTNDNEFNIIEIE